MDTIVGLLRARAVDGGGGYRFLDRDERATWQDLGATWDQASRTAGGLRALGVRDGDVVALMLPTGPAFLSAWFGCQILGAVPVALYPPVRLGRLDEFFARTDAMLGAVGARLLLTEPRIKRLLGRLVERRPIAVRDVPAGDPVDGPLPDADHLAMIQFSSGTTTDPKPVALTHRQVLANASAIAGAVRTTRGVCWLPLYHDMGLIGCVVPAVLVPGELTLIPPELFLARPAIWLRAIGRYRAAVSPAPSFAYALCAERIRDDELEGVDLSCWTMALNGAEPISIAACTAFVERFARWGLPRTAIVPVYGLSEMSLAVTFAEVGQPLPVRRWSGLAEGRPVEDPDGVPLVDVGRPLPGYDVDIRDGRVWVRGPSRMAGYLGRPAPEGEWLDTGDLGFLTDGRLTITGRAKDLIVLRGRNHAPQDLERAVDGVQGVRTGCVAAVADVGPDGERLLLFVEVREASPGLADRCAAALVEAAGVRADLVALLAPGTLPRTSSGKIRRGEALARWRAGTLTPPDRVTPLHLAGALARSALGFLRARS